MEKKIAETINVRINLGNFQHIEISKYAEQTIQFETKEEMVEKEDLLTTELVENIVRNMRTIPEKLGKKTQAVQEVEERISTTIPEWLKSNEEPNLAKKKHIADTAKQKQEKDKEEDQITEIDTIMSDEKQTPEPELAKVGDAEETNLFDDSDLDSLFE